MYGTLNKDQQLILLACRTSIPTGRLQQLTDIISGIDNWEKVAEIVRLNGVSAIFYHTLLDTGLIQNVPEPIRSVLQQSFYSNITRNTWLDIELKRILSHFQSINIPVMPIKGLMLGKFIYGDTGLRQNNDIDILVETGNGQSAWESLKTIGYRRYKPALSKWYDEHWQELAKHLPDLTNGQSSLDIHVTLFHGLKDHKTLTSEAWSESKVQFYEEYPIHIMRPEHQLIFLSSHIDNHLKNGQFQLRLFVDLAETIRRYFGQIDWNYLDSLATRAGMEINFKSNLHIVGVFLDAEFPEMFKLQGKTSIKNISRLEKEFIRRLEKSKFTNPHANVFPGLIKSLKSFNKPGQILHYLMGRMFPSKEFMLRRYRPGYPKLYYFYYFRRMIDGILRIFQSRRS